MNGRCAYAVFFQLLGQSVGAVLGAGEDQYLVPTVVADQVAEQGGLAALVDVIHPLLDRIGGGVGCVDFDPGRVAQVAGGEFSYFLREGGGKHQGLATLGQQFHNPADIVDKAHIEHAVRLVQHQYFEVIELYSPLAV